MRNETEYRRLPNRGSHNCFGCSPDNPSGLHMEFYTDGKALFSWLTVPEYLCGWDSLVHGGIISTILDETMGWSTLHLLGKFPLTKSMTVEFLRPLQVGHQVKAEGRVLEVKSDREAVLQGLLHNPEGALCARATGTFALFTLEAATKLGILNEKILHSIAHLIKVR